MPIIKVVIKTRNSLAIIFWFEVSYCKCQQLGSVKLGCIHESVFAAAGYSVFRVQITLRIEKIFCRRYDCR